MRAPRVLGSIVVVCALVAGAGCSSDDKASIATTTAAETLPASTVVETTAAVETTVAPETTVASETTVAAAANYTIDYLSRIVGFLASDELAGRDNLTDASVAAQNFLTDELATFTQPLAGDPSDPEAYKQPFDLGTNLVGVIPGTELPDEYVIIGAHYDHLGSDCPSADPADTICNGATDNATGVAVALAIGQLLAIEEDGPRRSVIIALWDAEEDGLLGSAAYLAAPLVPLDQTVAYINFDIQGTNISPALRNVTVAVGAETGGVNLVDSTRAATTTSTLDTVMLSLLFGQGRSDHANFVNAGIPSVFFTDATPPCYHTAGDEISIVDYPKLEQQFTTALSLAIDLVSTEKVPEFVPDAPPATYDDAVAIYGLMQVAQPDFDRFSAADRATADQFVTDMGVIVDAGPGAFDDAAVGVLLGGTVQIVTLWASGECDGFLS